MELAVCNTLAALGFSCKQLCKRVRSIDSMRCALLIVHAQALQCLRTHAVRGKLRAAAVDLDAANAKAKRVWAEVAVAAPELAPDTRPFGDGVRPFFLPPRAGAVRAPRRTMVFCGVREAARDAGSPSSARRLLFPA